MAIYGHGFYVERDNQTTHAATTVLTEIIHTYGPLHSAIDVGCGVGTWLRVAQELGIGTVQGVDGPWVERKLLQIPVANFRTANFGSVNDALDFGRRFDLAICLEVAEHIDPTGADTFARKLMHLADIVLFSAAVPHQGGVGHVNEQWPGYWIARFRAGGYELHDSLRRQIWNDASIPWWYRQNLMVFLAPSVASRIPRRSDDLLGIPVIHPDLFLESKIEISGREALRLVCKKMLAKAGIK